MTPALPPAISAPLPAAVTGPSVAAVLAAPSIRVTSSFRGATVSVFGSAQSASTAPLDVVVIIHGPERPVRIARKVQRFGLWFNSRPVVFRGAPGFYAISATRPLDDILSPAAQAQLGAGLRVVPMHSPEVEMQETADLKLAYELGPDNPRWREGVIRLKRQQGLYREDETGVRFVDRGLFRTSIPLPASAPTGVYDARIIVVREGVPVARRDRQLTVEKVGLERWIWQTAHRHRWLYGLACVALALGAGWLSSRLFRRA